MKTLTIRGVPDEVYASVREQAAASHRSLQEQVRWVLAKEARLRGGGLRQSASRWRRALAGRERGDTVSEIRAARERR